MSKRHKMKYPKPLGEIIRQEFTMLGLGGRLREADIWRIWPEAVGEMISRRATPLRIINGVLTVAVSSGPWMQELRYMSEMIQEKLNSMLGCEVVKSLVLKSGKPKFFAEPAPEEIPAKKRLTPHQKQFIRQQAAALPDAELQKIFSELMKASYLS